MESKVEDLSLPNAVVQRIIKEAVPPGTIVAKDARLAISRVRLYIQVEDPSIFEVFFINIRDIRRIDQDLRIRFTNDIFRQHHFLFYTSGRQQWNLRRKTNGKL